MSVTRVLPQSQALGHTSEERAKIQETEIHTQDATSPKAQELIIPI